MQDRAQTWLDLLTVPAAGGVPTKLFRDSTKAYIDDPGKLKFLKDGTFLMFSERTGYKHLYHYTAAGKLLGTVTAGDWQVRTVPLIDEKNGWVYFTGTKDGHLGSNLYRVKLDGSGLKRLTEGVGTHNVKIDLSGETFTDVWSNHKTPPQTLVYKTDGTLISRAEGGAVKGKGKGGKGKKGGGNVELVQIPTPDGFTLDAIITRPPNFDPTKKYPVWVKTYGGPHAPQVRDAWGVGDPGTAAQGYIVFTIDPRSATARVPPPPGPPTVNWACRS